ncbi:MAG TPA: hypothetical protein PK087_04760 [Bacilli bacterium]|nr:hypothetical protein [Bacilli bacterium]HPN61061.1 hypothetical protein [Bacilli bacterium]
MFLSTTFSTEFFIPIIILLGIATIFTFLIKVLNLKFLPVFALFKTKLGECLKKTAKESIIY